MFNSKFSRLGISCALAALLNVASPGLSSVRAAASSSPSAQLLNSKLPRGKSLKRASCEETFQALKAAITERPDLVLGLLRTAVKARSAKEDSMPCDCSMLGKYVQLGIDAAPEKARELVENALSLDPECADTFSPILSNAGGPGSGLEVADTGFGAGFGPGFPGSPGFVGSAPGGTIALPPVGVAVTSDTND